MIIRVYAGISLGGQLHREVEQIILFGAFLHVSKEIKKMKFSHVRLLQGFFYKAGFSNVYKFLQLARLQSSKKKFNVIWCIFLNKDFFFKK